MSSTTEQQQTAPIPGSAEWLRHMTASKVSAVMGTSPYESAFSLWHRMAGQVPGEVENDEMRYGLIIEPALIAWFAATHPDLTLDPSQPFWLTSDRFPWAAATPDSIVVEPDGRRVPLEVKTGRDSWEWAESDTTWVPGEPLPIPPGYFDQVQWQMLVMSAPHAYVAADVMMSLRWYRIDRDVARQDLILAACQEFMDSLAAHQAPPIDGSTFTYRAIRELHPDIDDVDVEIDAGLVARWLNAKTSVDIATTEEQAARSLILDALGTGRRATWRGQPLLTRQARGAGLPYAVAARHLPTSLTEPE